MKPTHAGGMVYRQAGENIEYLLVRPKRGLAEWVLPKGHIEPGEKRADAAWREVLEETGVEARLVAPLGMIEFKAKGKTVRAEYFLMEHRSVGRAVEKRETTWADYDKALILLTHESNRDILRLAEKQRRSSR